MNSSDSLRMILQDHLQVDDIEPAVELASRLSEVRDAFESKAFLECDAPGMLGA